MKTTTQIIIFVSLFFTITLFFPTVFLNVNAQSVITEKQTEQEKQEEREVKKFADLFAQNLEETKDLNKVSKRFFVSDFKTNMKKLIDKWFMEYSNIIQLNSKEKDEFATLWINYSYLALMTNNGNCCEGGEFYPPEVLKIIKHSKLLAPLISDGDIKIKNLEDMNNIIIDMKKLINSQRVYLQNRPQNWKSKYRINILTTRKKFEYFRIFSCSEDDCENFPQGTQIIETAVFPFILRIIKRDKVYKILNIFPYTN